MKKILIFIRAYFFLLVSPFKSKKTILNSVDTVKFVKKNKKSIIRYGDGEFRIMLTSKNIDYQKASAKLSNDLIKIVDSYNNDSNYLLCLPPFLKENIIWYFLKQSKYTLCFSIWRLFFKKKMKKMIYGDAFLFKNGNLNVYESLWKDSKNIILVHNNVKWANALKSRYKCNVEFIEVPSENSYDKIDSIYDKIIQKLNSSKMEYTILISAGPMAKVLVYRLAKVGIVSYDTGHCFDEPLNLE